MSNYYVYIGAKCVPDVLLVPALFNSTNCWLIKDAK